MGELRGWAEKMARPSAILIVSAHWQTAPIALSATRPVPLVYDFYGFPEHYYAMTYEAPGAPGLAAKVKGLMPANEPILDRETRGLDHGAWVPLKAMYPDADVPVLQMSLPTHDPDKLLALGWEPEYTHEEAIRKTARWYVDNRWWWEPIRSGEFKEYYQRLYGERKVIR